MRNLLTLCCAASLAGLFLTGCNMPGSEADIGRVGSIQAWIDAPLDGSTIPLAPYEVVMHAYDPGGVSQIELSANGSLLAALPNPNSGQLLATLKYVWSPAVPGNYTLTARAQGANGLIGSETIARITVAGELALAAVTISPTPLYTLTPTDTPTSTVTPASAVLTFTPRVSESQFYYGSCTPNQVTIQALVSGGSVNSVVLFLKLQDQSSGSMTDWDGGTSMTPSGDGWFARTVSASSLAGADSIESGWLLYQFVATDNTGASVGRSQVYSDVALSSCGAFVPPVRRIDPPTSPPSFRPLPQFNFVTDVPTLIPPPK